MANLNKKMFWHNSSFYVKMTINGKRKEQIVAVGTPEQKAAFKAGKGIPVPSAEQTASYYREMAKICLIEETESQIAGHGVLTVKALAVDFLRSPNQKTGAPRVAERQEQLHRYIGRFVKAFGDKAVADVEEMEVSAKFTTREARKAIKQMFQFAVLKGKIVKNPMIGLPVPSGKKNNDYLMTDADHAFIMANTSRRFQRFYIVQKTSGRRPSALARILSAKVKFQDNAAIALVHGKNTWRDGKYETLVFVHPDAITALREACQANPDGYAFCQKNGKPYQRSAWVETYRRLYRKGLNRKCKMYSCKKFFITTGLNAGIPASVMSDLTDVSVRTLDTRYTIKGLQHAGIGERLKASGI